MKRADSVFRPSVLSSISRRVMSRASSPLTWPSSLKMGKVARYSSSVIEPSSGRAGAIALEPRGERPVARQLLPELAGTGVLGRGRRVLDLDVRGGLVDVRGHRRPSEVGDRPAPPPPPPHPHPPPQPQPQPPALRM